MNKHQKKLKKFYQELAVWINAGMPEHKVFRKSSALCNQLWSWTVELPWYARLYYNKHYILHLQTEMFRKDFGNASFPFGTEAYMEEHVLDSHYTNEARLAFIFEQAGVPREI